MSFITGYIQNFISVFCAMAPWLLMGYFLAGVIAFFLKVETVRKHLGGKGFLPVLKAVLLGIPLPVCSCGVIPIAAALRNEGAGRGATGAFFISTPQTGIDSIIVTASMMGIPFALIRPLAAFLSGLTGGLLISKFCPSGSENQTVEKKGHCCCCGKHAQQNEKNWKNAPVFILSYGFIRMMKSTAPSLLQGMAAAALIQQILPANFGAEYLHGNPFLEFAAVLFLSVPLYVCSSASVPVALALLLKGFSPGAALLFLIAGPGIHSVSITSMRQIIGGKAAAIVVGSVAFWAVAAGILANVFDLPVSRTSVELAVNSTSTLKTVCGIILALLVFRAVAARFIEQRSR